MSGCLGIITSYGTNSTCLVYPSSSISHCHLPIRLDGLADELEEIAAEQGTNVNRIVELVNENERILAAMKTNLRQTVVTALAKIIMRSDGKFISGDRI